MNWNSLFDRCINLAVHNCNQLTNCISIPNQEVAGLAQPKRQPVWRMTFVHDDMLPFFMREHFKVDILQPPINTNFVYVQFVLVFGQFSLMAIDFLLWQLTDFYGTASQIFYF